MLVTDDSWSWWRAAVIGMWPAIGVATATIWWRGGRVDARGPAGVFLVIVVTWLLLKCLLYVAQRFAGPTKALGSCLFWVVSIPLASLLGWKGPLAIVSVYAVLVVLAVRSVARLRSRLKLIEGVEHPHGPEAKWIIAVSRRYNVPAIDAWYEATVKPVLAEYGIVVECEASDAPGDLHYWASRMVALLELSDVHVLIDYQPTVHTVFEQLQSRQLQRNPSNSMLSVIWGFDHPVAKLKTRAFAVTLGPGTAARRESLANNSVFLSPERLAESFGDELRNAVELGLKWHAGLLESALNESRARGASGLRAKLALSIEDYEKMSVARTAVASWLMTPEGREFFDAHMNENRQEYESSDAIWHLAGINRQLSFFLHVFADRGELPRTFCERVRLFQRYRREVIGGDGRAALAGDEDSFKKHLTKYGTLISLLEAATAGRVASVIQSRIEGRAGERVPEVTSSRDGRVSGGLVPRAYAAAGWAEGEAGDRRGEPGNDSSRPR